MAKIDITRTELVWPGKYNEDGTLKEVPRVSLPFQVIETVNESRATREAKKGQTMSLFDTYEGNEGDTFEAGWRNKLIWGDNLLVMGSLLEKFAGKIDLIYIDPPFATGADFSFTAEIGDGNIRLGKGASVVEEKAYRDTWGHGLTSYTQMMSDRLKLMRSLLSQEGHLLVHIAPNVSPYLRLILDEVFGLENFRNEIVINRPITKNLQRQFKVITALPQGHDVLLWYSAQPSARVPNLLVPYESLSPEGYWHRFWSGADRPSMRGQQRLFKPLPGRVHDEIEHAALAAAGETAPAPGLGVKRERRRAVVVEGTAHRHPAVGGRLLGLQPLEQHGTIAHPFQDGLLVLFPGVLSRAHPILSDDSASIW